MSDIDVAIPGKVEDLLQQFRIQTPPVPVEKIARKLGILICPLPALGEALSLDRFPFQARLAEIGIIGKGQKPRTIFPNERSLFWINQYLARRTDQNPALFVTVGEPTSRWAQVDVSKYFIELGKSAGLKKKVTPHILRHTFCTNLLSNGADITYIRDLAGHADIETTARYYLRVDNAALKRALNKYLDYRLKPSDTSMTVTPPVA